MIGDFLYLFAGFQPDAQAAVAGLECVRMFDPQRQGHDQVIAVAQTVEGGVLGQQMPGFVDHLAILNDSLHIRAP
ncbi:hypothetical protein D3C80_1754900 [compost metagenome]